MAVRVSTGHRAINLGLVMAVALALWGCGGKTPTGPTATGPIRGQGAIDGTAFAPTSVQHSTDAAGAVPAPPIVSWSCFTAAAAGAFGAPSDCPAPRLTAQTIEIGDSVVTTPPTTLTRLVQGTTVTLGWGVPPGSAPTSYVIEAGSTPGSSNITTFDTGSSATGLTVTNVPAGTYFVRVRGRDASGTGPASNEVPVVVTGPGPAPGLCEPRGLIATAIGSAVAIAWVEPPGAGGTCGTDRYLIQAGSAPGASDLIQIETVGLFSSHGATGLAPGTYYVRVRSRGASILSNPSNEVVVTVTGILPPGTTTWTGLVANGDGVTISDDDCGLMRLDITTTLVQSGTSVTGILTNTIRVAPNCPTAVGFTLSEPLSGTVTGSLADGSGTFTVTTGTTGMVTGSFANGRMTGTISVIGEEGTGTVTMHRQ
jgi:hypothetical protein